MTPDSLPDSTPEPAPDETPHQTDAVSGEGGGEAPASASADTPELSDAAGMDASPPVETADVASSVAPAVESPAADIPSVDSSATESPTTESPTAESPAADSPAAEIPAADSPAAESPAVEQPEPEPRPEPDPVLVDAVEVARAAAVEVGGHDVGEHLGVSAEDAHAVTHAFAATLAGYRGWHWAVTVARSPQSEVVTVDEVVLLPGDDALRPPAWVPWSERVRAGDLGAGDLLPADPDDARLVPSYFSDGDPALADVVDADRAQMRAVADELGLGRVRVLSRDGRLDAAERWLEADFGPDAPMAKQAPAHCGTCGFLLLVGGSLGAAFGVCANELSAADAHVVSVEFGCGAHSEAGVDLSNRVEPAGSVYDSGELVIEPTDHEGPVAVDDV